MKRFISIFSVPIFLYSAALVVIAFLLFRFENRILLEEQDLAPQIDYEAPEPAEKQPPLKIYSDIEPQKPLSDPPRIVKAVYLTSWAAGTEKFTDYVINLAKTTEINAVVIDIKDFSGLVAYASDIEAVKKYSAREVRIPKINSLIKKFHDAGIYVIARQTVFQDPVLARARPDLAVQSRKLLGSSTAPTADTLWLDRKGLAWIDPASKEAWDYNVAIAREAASRGFDEINFDYIRFPSDGDTEDTKFLFWDEVRLARSVIKDFFSYLRQELGGVKISADLFGLTTVDREDLGIGQLIENAYEFFDFVSPMVYPSHYAFGFQGFGEPAAYPYEVIRYSLDNALSRLMATSTSGIIFQSKLRPWLQDFTLRGVVYDTEKVKAEIKAVHDSLGEHFSGFMLWSPTNLYTASALEPE